MTVYVDDMLMQATVPNGSRSVTGKWSHLMADTREELDAFAQKIGMKPAWIQHPGEWHEHYDVTAPKRALAIRLGAQSIGYGSSEATALMNRKRQALGMTLIGNGLLEVPSTTLFEMEGQS